MHARGVEQLRAELVEGRRHIGVGRGVRFATNQDARRRDIERLGGNTEVSAGGEHVPRDRGPAIGLLGQPAELRRVERGVGAEAEPAACGGDLLFRDDRQIAELAERFAEHERAAGDEPILGWPASDVAEGEQQQASGADRGCRR